MDETGTIFQEYAHKYPFIKYIMLPNRGYRLPAKGVVDTFNRGLHEVEDIKHDILSNYDGELEFPPGLISAITSALKKTQS